MNETEFLTSHRPFSVILHLPPHKPTTATTATAATTHPNLPTLLPTAAELPPPPPPPTFFTTTQTSPVVSLLTNTLPPFPPCTAIPTGRKHPAPVGEHAPTSGALSTSCAASPLPACATGSPVPGEKETDESL